jgi:hypothetical protein
MSESKRRRGRTGLMASLERSASSYEQGADQFERVYAWGRAPREIEHTLSTPPLTMTTPRSSQKEPKSKPLRQHRTLQSTLYDSSTRLDDKPFILNHIRARTKGSVRQQNSSLEQERSLDADEVEAASLSLSPSSHLPCPSLSPLQIQTRSSYERDEPIDRHPRRTINRVLELRRRLREIDLEWMRLTGVFNRDCKRRTVVSQHVRRGSLSMRSDSSSPGRESAHWG